MPRNSSGTYTLPIGAFSPNTLIKSSDHNSNYSDIATALTQSVATTGVSTMTGALKAAAGSVGAPSITFAGDPTSGLFLAGTHQIGFATNGTQVATFNNDQSVSWAGAASWSGAVTYSGALTINGAVTLNATSYSFGAGAAAAWWAGIASNFSIEVAFDGGGSAIAGNTFAFVEVPCNCTVKRITMLGDQSGSAGVWVGTNTFSGFAGSGGFSNISSASSFPTPNLSFSSATKAQDSTLTGWTTALTAGELVGFFVGGNTNVGNPATNVQRLTVSLLCQRTGS
jgi:hypothetical protein